MWEHATMPFIDGKNPFLANRRGVEWWEINSKANTGRTVEAKGQLETHLNSKLPFPGSR